MPFRKISDNEYQSPSGRKYTRKQVTMYYATDGFKKSKIRGKKRAKRREK